MTIARPIGEVFQFLSQPEHLAKWDSAVRWARRTTSGPFGVGTTFEEAIERDGQTAVAPAEVVAYEPPAQLGWRSDLGGTWVVTRITLEAVGTDTRLRLSRWAIGQGGVESGCPPLAADLLRLRQVLEDRTAG